MKKLLPNSQYTRLDNETGNYCSHQKIQSNVEDEYNFDEWIIDEDDQSDQALRIYIFAEDDIDLDPSDQCNPEWDAERYYRNKYAEFDYDYNRSDYCPISYIEWQTSCSDISIIDPDECSEIDDEDPINQKITIHYRKRHFQYDSIYRVDCYGSWVYWSECLSYSINLGRNVCTTGEH